MKKLVYLFLVLFVTPIIALAEPYYNYDNYGNYIGEPKAPIVYDISYNVALYNKLNNDYDKRHLIKVLPNGGHIFDSPANSFGEEVLAPYYELRKTNDEMIQEALNQKKK